MIILAIIWLILFILSWYTKEETIGYEYNNSENFIKFLDSNTCKSILKLIEE